MRPFLPILAVLGMAAVSLAQTPDDPQEGTRLERDSVNSVWLFRWWARADRTYFFQYSEDLSVWTWMDEVVAGNDTARQMVMNTTAEKFFMRLVHTDQTSSDPATADFDGDGINNLAETENETDPFLNVDSDGDRMPDDWEVANGLDPADFFNGQPPILSIESGNEQGGLAGTTMESPLVAKLTNSFGTPKSGEIVTFIFSENSEAVGELSTLEAGVTDGNGLARAVLTLPNQVGAHVEVLATFQTAAVFFQASVGDPTLAPAAPGRPEIDQAYDSTTATVTWKDNSNNENGFHIERSLNNQTWNRIGTVGPNVNSYTDEGITANRPHSYRIVVFNNAQQ